MFLAYNFPVECLLDYESELDYHFRWLLILEVVVGVN
jgi:hypothetical protein